MRRFLLFIIFFSGVTAVSAQFTSRLGRFQVDQVRGCAPFTINITDTNRVTTGECTPGKPCLMDYQGNGTTSTNQFSFTYNTPGTYKLSVLYQSIGADDITVTVDENIDPIFEVYTCTGTEVSIKVTDKSYQTYQVDFDNASGPFTVDTTIPSGNNAVAQHNYGATGTYTIAVRGKNNNAASNCRIRLESYQTLATLPTPAINIATAVDANNVKLDLTASPQIQYKLEISLNSTNFQVYQNLYEVNTVTVPNLLLDNNYYCFRLSAFDPCKGTNTYSNIICTQDFDVAFNNGSNDLTWRTSTTGINRTEIRRNGTTYSSIPGAPLGFQDNDYDCNKDYCYQVITNYAGGARSISLSKCGTGILTTTFPPIENVSTVVRAGVELLWNADPTIDIQNFDVWKSTAEEPLRFFALTQEEKYIDATYDYKPGICYQVNYSDFCNNKSYPGIIACPLHLTGGVDEKNGITLNWNAYRGWTDGVNTYRINKYNAGGALIDQFDTSDTTFVDNDPDDQEQIVIYSITAIPIIGGVDRRSISNQLRIEKEVRLILPTAFTPNGDGVNPLFTISGKFVSKMSIQIFDKWGVLVFSSDKNEPWDGTRAGKVMPESAYIWKAEVVDFAGRTFSKEGTVLLLRPPR